MNHRQIQEKLDAYLDRELSPADEQEVARHLTSCGTCRETTEGLKQLHHFLSAAPRPIESEAFVERVMRGLSPPWRPPMLEPARSTSWILRWWSPALALAGALYVITLSVRQPTPVVSTESILLAEFQDDVSQFMFSRNASVSAPLVGTMEDML